MTAHDAAQWIPTLVLHQNGATAAQGIGTQDAEKSVDWLADHDVIES